ncbi:MAG: hypothetical protein F6J98_07385 [Moorea sp. SIO4G2]|uniref:Uncharacterized protein n=1 Tax=Moorena bouillonii PNG TaxID=568701 RepID=A0A1U7MW45_9CYAN|nr:hypothetical protein [Moorena bouillonii]NEO60259.1 hypothetical protein [Moorena sp. SIO4G2]OLT57938.1 hypothetical protein BJP37_01650 [Moorena bouillonii PNG]
MEMSLTTRKPPMNSIDFPTLITTIFVLVDYWYQQKIKPLLLLKAGAKARLSDSDSEVEIHTVPGSHISNDES